MRHTYARTSNAHACSRVARAHAPYSKSYTSDGISCASSQRSWQRKQLIANSKPVWRTTSLPQTARDPSHERELTTALKRECPRYASSSSHPDAIGRSYTRHVRAPRRGGGNWRGITNIRFSSLRMRRERDKGEKTKKEKVDFHFLCSHKTSKDITN